jgi:short-subunit dehydrogenase
MVNLSSVAALIMNPFASVYSATKGYNRHLSLALSAEYHSQSLDVLCVEPGLVESNMTKIKPSPVCCSARECAESALRKAGDVECIPHWKHMAMYVASAWYKLLPSSLQPPFVSFMVGTFRQKTAASKSD